jgi:6-phosphogluconolactonase/glucosamine-6-phosphate isomerase/deaminase
MPSVVTPQSPVKVAVETVTDFTVVTVVVAGAAKTDVITNMLISSPTTRLVRMEFFITLPFLKSENDWAEENPLPC